MKHYYKSPRIEIVSNICDERIAADNSIPSDLPEIRTELEPGFVSKDF